jgi:hypothetical protein
MLGRMGLNLDRFADSTGPLPGLDDVGWTSPLKGS